MVWKVWGTEYKKPGKLEGRTYIETYVEAMSFDEAISKARILYGSFMNAGQPIEKEEYLYGN